MSVGAWIGFIMVLIVIGGGIAYLRLKASKEDGKFGMALFFYVFIPLAIFILMLVWVSSGRNGTSHSV